ncbi:MAG: pyridoxamine 5'-phosphate oxidase family protein [Candidatus Omnitrophota bacterium]|nr:pyridoxamine 5'-phosphate oxidase family protein [Candidatus Omnitrophota bacterium]
MQKQEVIDLIKDAGFGVLATVDGGQPKARPMMPYLDEDGNLLLAVLAHSRTISQISQNPQVEMCYIDRKMCFARISGKAKISENKDKKQQVWYNIPMLRQYFTSLEDPNFVLIEIDTESVEAMSPQQRKPDVLTLK